jgi:2-dehydro-3-deoxyphosphogalactonate aldolase
VTLESLLASGSPPIVAILRGVRPDEAVAIGRAIVEAGICVIEVPFNSPEPARSIAALVDAFGEDALIGGGTVIEPAMVDTLARAGGRFMVAPNSDRAVIAACIAAGIEAMPGFVTPSEAFAALAAGAAHLKLFPATGYGPSYLRALAEALPAETPLWAVGGTGAHNLGEWIAAGARGIGVGSALYRAGDAPATVSARATALVAAWRGGGT